MFSYSSNTIDDSTSSPRRTSSKANNELVNLRLAAFINEPLERGNRNVMLPDQSGDASVTMKKAKSAIAKKLNVILDCCQLQ